MRSILSLLVAFIIFLAVFLFAFFYINISSGAKFERTDQEEEKTSE